MGASIRRKFLGTKQMSKLRTKAPAAYQLLFLKNRKGGLNDQSAGVPAQGTPTSRAECLFAQWSPPPHLPSRVCWDGAWRRAPPPVKLGEQGATCSEFLGGFAARGPPDASTSLAAGAAQEPRLPQRRSPQVPWPCLTLSPAPAPLVGSGWLHSHFLENLQISLVKSTPSPNFGFLNNLALPHAAFVGFLL